MASASQSGETSPAPIAIEASPVVGEIEARGYLFRLRYGPENWSRQLMYSEVLPDNPDDVKEVEALVPAASLASLQSDNQALREEVERLTDPAYLTTALEKVGVVDAEWQSRAEAAESQVQSLTLKLEERDKALEAERWACIMAASDYCWQRYKGRDPMNLKSPAVFSSHEWQKIEEHIRAIRALQSGGAEQ